MDQPNYSAFDDLDVLEPESWLTSFLRFLLSCGVPGLAVVGSLIVLKCIAYHFIVNGDKLTALSLTGGLTVTVLAAFLGGLALFWGRRAHAQNCQNPSDAPSQPGNGGNGAPKT